AISVRAVIGLAVKKLLDQVAVCTVQLDAVKSCGQRVARAFTVSLDDSWNLSDLKCAGGLEWHHLERRRERLAGSCNRRWSHRQRAVRLEAGMGHATNVPKLHENHAALGVHCIRDLLPSCDLFRRMNAGRRRIA